MWTMFITKTINVIHKASNIGAVHRLHFFNDLRSFISNKNMANINNQIMVDPRSVLKVKSDIYGHFTVPVYESDPKKVVVPNNFLCKNCKTWVYSDTRKY